MKKTTIFSLLCQACGLSHREAADFLNTRIDTVKSWSSGRNPTPPGIIDELSILYGRIRKHSEIAGNNLVPGDGANTLYVGTIGDWPCAGVKRAVLARIASQGIVDGYSFVIAED